MSSKESKSKFVNKMLGGLATILCGIVLSIVVYFTFCSPAAKRSVRLENITSNALCLETYAYNVKFGPQEFRVYVDHSYDGILESRSRMKLIINNTQVSAVNREVYIGDKETASQIVTDLIEEIIANITKQQEEMLLEIRIAKELEIKQVEKQVEVYVQNIQVPKAQ